MPFASLDSTIFTFVPTATDGSTVVVTDFESSVKERVFFPTRTSIFLPASYSLTVPTTVWPLYFIVPSVVVTFFSSVFSIGLSCANAAEPPSKSTEGTGKKNLLIMSTSFDTSCTLRATSRVNGRVGRRCGHLEAACGLVQTEIPGQLRPETGSLFQ